MKNCILRKLIFKLILSFVLFTIPYPLYCQQVDVERATRETDRLRPEEIESKLKRIPRKPPQLKPEEIQVEKGGQKFLIKKINLLGCESFVAQEFDPIIKKYENKEVTLNELDSLAKEIETEYLKRGVIAAVFLPPQDIKEETVVLQVVEAHMGQLQIQKHKYFNNERLNYYWKIPRDEVLRYDMMAKSIQMMNKNPDREVKAALHAGKKQGATDVILTPKVTFPAHVTASFDNEGTISTGKSRTGFGLRHNNLLGLDDTLLSGYTYGKDFSGIYAYHTLPINYNGMSFMYGYSSSKSAPKKEFTEYGINSWADSISLSVHQDLYNKGEYIGEVYGGFDAKDKVTKMADYGTTNRDRLRIFSVGSSFLKRGLGSTSYASLDLAQGIDAFGASRRGNPLASRGAKSRFTKFNIGAQHRRLLPLNLQASLKFKSQIASTKLTPQEEFSLGGIDSVRGYPPDDYRADNAVFTSAELLIPSFFIPKGIRIPYAKESLKEETTLVAFLDYGHGMRKGALITEKAHVDMLSLGTGVRFRLFDQALLRLEWGFPVAADKPITEAGHSHFHFSVDFQDKLPEEIERIRQLSEEENIRQWAWHLVDAELSKAQSSLREKMVTYISLAQAAYKQGKLQESKEFYENVLQISRSLYQQAEDYVRSCLEQEKVLRGYQETAALDYKEGRLTQAKELLQKIIDEGSPRSLVLEF